MKKSNHKIIIIIVLCLLLLPAIVIDGRILLDEAAVKQQQSLIERFMNFFRSIFSFLRGGNRIKCGTNTCYNNEFCCNESCSICAKQGDGCIKKYCLPTPTPSPTTIIDNNNECINDNDCPIINCIRAPCPINTCVDQQFVLKDVDDGLCGNTTCGKGQYCCNKSCSICVQDGNSCNSEECCTDDSQCSPYICRACTPNVQKRVCNNGVCVLP